MRQNGVGARNANARTATRHSSWQADAGSGLSSRSSFRGQYLSPMGPSRSSAGRGGSRPSQNLRVRIRCRL